MPDGAGPKTGNRANSPPAPRARERRLPKTARTADWRLPTEAKAMDSSQEKHQEKNLKTLLPQLQ